MDANEYRKYVETLGGVDPERSRATWDAMPDDEKAAWCRGFVDFPPTFPGATIMAAISRRVREGGFASWVSWREHAGAFSLLGFSQYDYYMLRVCADRRREELLLRRDLRLVVPDQRVGTFFGLVPDTWAPWLTLVHGGVTPMTAVDSVAEFSWRGRAC